MIEIIIKAMTDRDSIYRLANMIEFDDIRIAEFHALP
jgi:hypothetical protein